jgi:hypothetical protein
MARSVALLSVLLLTAQIAPASTHTWIGPATGGNWSESANWSNGIPTTGEVGGTIVEMLGGIVSTSDIDGLVVDQIRLFGAANTLATPPYVSLRLNAALLTPTVVAEGGASHIISADLLNQGCASSMAPPVIAIGEATQVTLSGAINGGSNFSKDGPGTLVFSGTNLVGWGTSGFAVRHGTLIMNSSEPNVKDPNAAYIGDGSGPPGSATLHEMSDENLGDGALVGVKSDGYFDLDAFSDRIGSLSGGGTVHLSGGTLTISAYGTFSGSFTGNGAVICDNGGYTWRATGVSTLSGHLGVSWGTVQLAGAVVPATVGVCCGGRLDISDDAAIGALTVGGTGSVVAPGGDGGAGFVSTAGLQIRLSGTYGAVLRGTSPGAFSRIAVTGAVDLSGAALAVTVAFVPDIGDSFMIIDNDGEEPVTGAFANLPEGASLDVGGQTFQITYSGGTGNDVVLTRVDCANDTGAPLASPPAGVIVMQTVCG